MRGFHIFPELSNSGSPPAQPVVYPKAIITGSIDHFHELPRRLSENSVRREIERKFRRQGGKGKITGGVVDATLRIFWPFQRGRRNLQPVAAGGYCRTASQCPIDGFSMPMVTNPLLGPVEATFF